MKAHVTDAGLLIPRDLLEGVSEVDIRRGDRCLFVMPLQDDDPILQLGDSPVTSDVSDASVRHDAYVTSV